MDDKYKKRLNMTNAYNKIHYKPITIRLSYDKEDDIINWLNNFDSIKAYLVEIIRADMRAKQGL